MVIGDVLRVLAGLVLLTLAADRLVVAAARLSRLWGLSPVLIGALIIGLGTSLPEFLVSSLAAARPMGLDLALGNVVGSNIANLSLVLGTSVLIAPMAGHASIIRREGLVMLLGSCLIGAAVWGGRLERSQGVGLVVAMVIAFALFYRWARHDESENDLESEVDEMVGAAPVSTRRESIIGLVSLAVTLLGAELLLDGAQAIAEAMGVSQGLIGLTLVAVGTSLPELATAVAAARRRENDLVIGNVLGSNLFNALAVGGIAAIIGNGPLHADFRPAVVSMLVLSVVAGGLATTGDRLSRWEGIVLLLAYPVAMALTGM